MSKTIQIFLIFFFIEEYKFRTIFFVKDIFDNFNFEITFLKMGPNFVDSVEVQLGRYQKFILEE